MNLLVAPIALVVGLALFASRSLAWVLAAAVVVLVAINMVGCLSTLVNP
ncbi:MAG TPA: hypothetical protein VNI83_04090 [Vicinamibacterales bacterium]|nr:hypothetical protein [Vicinamibacterales bacterium]